MAVVEREYDFEGSTYGSGSGGDLLPEGSGDAEQDSRRMLSRWPPITAGRGHRLRVSLAE